MSSALKRMAMPGVWLGLFFPGSPFVVISSLGTPWPSRYERTSSARLLASSSQNWAEPVFAMTTRHSMQRGTLNMFAIFGMSSSARAATPGFLNSASGGDAVPGGTNSTGLRSSTSPLCTFSLTLPCSSTCLITRNASPAMVARLEASVHLVSWTSCRRVVTSLPRPSDSWRACAMSAASCSHLPTASSAFALEESATLRQWSACSWMGCRARSHSSVLSITSPIGRFTASLVPTTRAMTASVWSRIATPSSAVPLRTSSRSVAATSWAVPLTSSAAESTAEATFWTTSSSSCGNTFTSGDTLYALVISSMCPTRSCIWSRRPPSSAHCSSLLRHLSVFSDHRWSSASKCAQCCCVMARTSAS
mmetsp:Transcript_117859/g.334181  ORF Transcript_117859/g.334181 Transcript_117859/m.334181 type:complete len:363 (+) Transcript_117859:195-1283(+)